jgi:hypothetical protein
VISGRYEGIYGFLSLFVELSRDEILRELICGKVAVKACMATIIY